MDALKEALTENSKLLWKIQELETDNQILKNNYVALESQLTATKNLLDERENELGL